MVGLGAATHVGAVGDPAGDLVEEVPDLCAEKVEDDNQREGDQSDQQAVLNRDLSALILLEATKERANLLHRYTLLLSWGLVCPCELAGSTRVRRITPPGRW